MNLQKSISGRNVCEVLSMADNIKVKNIYYMLAYAFHALQESEYDSIAGEEFDHIHDLLAAILIQGVSNQVRRGLYREYISNELLLSGLRGRILISESIKQQTLQQRKLVCSFDEFTVDTLHNQVLKAAMRLLLRFGSVKVNHREQLRKLLLFSGDVADIAPSAIGWNRLKIHRNNAAYHILINICHLVIKGLLLTTEHGDYRLAKWLDDGQMHRLYEKFVFAYYKKEHRELNVSAAQIEWNVPKGADRTFLPRMQTDITLTRGDKILIIDTKWYSQTMQKHSMYDSTTFISNNLYQIYSYVKNMDQYATGNVAGTLLYAKTDEMITPDNDFIIGGNRISLKTLDLGQDWSIVIRQLDEMVSWLAM